MQDLLYTSALDGTIQVWRIPVFQTTSSQNSDNINKSVVNEGGMSLKHSEERGKSLLSLKQCNQHIVAQILLIIAFPLFAAESFRDPATSHQWINATTTTACANNPKAKRVEMLEFTRVMYTTKLSRATNFVLRFWFRDLVISSVATFVSCLYNYHVDE